MEIVPFIAESAADAARQVRERLGPEAVVVQVRPVPAAGRGWFGRKPRSRFEVLAYRPDPGRGPDAAPGPVERLDVVAGDHPAFPYPESAHRSSSSPGPSLIPNSNPGSHGPTHPPSADSEISGLPNRSGRPGVRSGGGEWRAGELLEAAGFLPKEAQRVVDRLRAEHGDRPPSALGGELSLIKRTLRDCWRSPAPLEPARGEIHVLIGAPGVGKTTCLCKWLTQVALGDGGPVRVWRLDGQTANTAEALAVYCDVLGVPLARSWTEDARVDPGGTGFVDLPGTDWRDAGALKRLADQVSALGRVRVHLVLNGAYDVALMMAQVRAFEGLPVEDLVLTHLDEESRWGKFWNLILGTNYSVRFLSAGQNVPGDFHAATAERLLTRQFRS
ncbi:MAG: hypothetical protein AB7O66_10830 [Limisphaerales bacterium]